MLERRPGPSTRVRVVEWRADASVSHEDRVATEEPLEVRVAWPGSRRPRASLRVTAGFVRGERMVAYSHPERFV